MHITARLLIVQARQHDGAAGSRSLYGCLTRSGPTNSVKHTCTRAPRFLLVSRAVSSIRRPIRSLNAHRPPESHGPLSPRPAGDRTIERRQLRVMLVFIATGGRGSLSTREGRQRSTVAAPRATREVESICPVSGLPLRPG